MRVLLYLLITLSCLSSGCATILHGSKEQVSISSNPAEVTVTVDSQELGKTPLLVKLPRKENHMVKVNLSGYMPYEFVIQRKVDALVVGNILFGGLIGLGVDAITGECINYHPTRSWRK